MADHNLVRAVLSLRHEVNATHIQRAMSIIEWQEAEIIKLENLVEEVRLVLNNSQPKKVGSTLTHLSVHDFYNLIDNVIAKIKEVQNS